MQEFLESDNETNSISKFLFTGLDNAGKTSIILAIKREFSKITNIKPTKSAQRRTFEFMGREISEWDLGGQESYRIAYLKKPSEYFDNTDVGIYVIDIQNRDRYVEALSYLNDVIEQFRKLDIEPPIHVFFHKYDPTISKGERNQFSDKSLNLKTEISKNVDYKKLYFHNTSIFNLPSLISAMSGILLTLYPSSELVEKTIENFGKKFNAEAVEVIDDNSLVVGSYYENDVIRDILTAASPYFLNLNECFEYIETKGGQYEDQMLIQRFGKIFFFIRFSLINGAPPFYILIFKETPLRTSLLKENPSFNKDEFDTFINLLKEIIKN